jgi:hypothetical protein
MNFKVACYSLVILVTKNLTLIILALVLLFYKDLLLKFNEDFPLFYLRRAGF